MVHALVAKWLNDSVSTPAQTRKNQQQREGKSRTARCLFHEQLVKPSAGSRETSMEDFQNVVRDLAVHHELFDSVLRPADRAAGGAPAALPAGRSFRCLRGSTFALHQFVSGTGMRFFLMTEASYSSAEAQRKLASIYGGPFLDLICRGECVRLRELLDAPAQVVFVEVVEGAGGVAVGGATHFVPAIPAQIQASLKREIVAILRS